MGGGNWQWLQRRNPLAAWRADSQPIAGETLIEKGFRFGLATVRSLSPYHLVLGHDLPGQIRQPGRSDRYVLAWFGVLGVAIWAINQGAAWLAAAVALAVLGRLGELYAYYLWEVVSTKPEGRSRRDRFALVERRILFLLVDVLQAMVCFGLLAQALGRLWPGQFVFAAGVDGKAPGGTFDYIYLAGGQMTSVGSKYAAVSAGAEALHLAMIGGGVVLLLVVFSSIVNIARPATESKTAE